MQQKEDPVYLFETARARFSRGTRTQLSRKVMVNPLSTYTYSLARRALSISLSQAKMPRSCRRV
jgi:hypothetical protein